MARKYPEYKQLDLVHIHREILDYWKENAIFDKSISTREGNEEFVFYEGPPSANGKPGIHHVMSRAIKDLFCRFKTLEGYQVKRKAGWDTHGLPVELGVEKELGITKEDIGEKISVKDYNEACKEAVMRYTDTWNHLTEIMGYWVDMDNPYVTYKPQYMETLWWLLKQLWDKELLYKGYTIQPYSPAAGTGLSSHELNMPGCYRDVKDTSAVAQFPLLNPKEFASKFKISDVIYQITKGDSSNLFQENAKKAANQALDAIENGRVYLLAWTTTPWTLPSNTALTVHPDITYSMVYCVNRYTDKGQIVLLAKKRLEAYFWMDNQPENLIGFYKSSGSGNIHEELLYLNEIRGEELINLRYEQLLPYVKPYQNPENAFRVIAGDFVTTDDGTGIVHTAPTFGADDAKVAKEASPEVPPMLVLDENENPVPLVDLQGKFRLEMGDLAGKFVKNEYYPEGKAPDKSVDVEIAIYLKEHNKAFKVEKYVHSYPHCWRTDKPVLYYPLDSWFVRVTAEKEKLVSLNKSINWKPASTGEGRFGNWLENANDWNLSRSRYWGTPLPIWSTEDGTERKIIGSVAELKEACDRAVEAGLMKEHPLQNFVPGDLSEENYQQVDLHRQVVDHLVLQSESGQPMYRENDLIDVWFDSGAMPYAQEHFPFAVDVGNSTSLGESPLAPEGRTEDYSSPLGKSPLTPKGGTEDGHSNKGRSETNEDYSSSLGNSPLTPKGGTEAGHSKKGSIETNEDHSSPLSNSPLPPKGGTEDSHSNKGNFETHKGAGWQTENSKNYEELRRRAEELKKEETQEEKLLWENLKSKGLEGFKFRRQHIIDNYIVDFVCLDKKLIVEVDGKIHKSSTVRANDERREEKLNELGYQILRFTNEEVQNDLPLVLTKIRARLRDIEKNEKNHLETPQDNRPPLGETGGSIKNEHIKIKPHAFPADFIAEGVDQTRGWFYTLHAIGSLVFDSVAYKNVVSNGLVLDKNGHKMSKRLGNAVDPFETIGKYGADAVRWYMISNAQPWDNLKFNLEGVSEVQRRFFGTLYHTYAFFALYANIDAFVFDKAKMTTVAQRPEIDRWIMSRLQELRKQVKDSYDDYEPTRATRLVMDFVDEELSNWYVRLGRRRFWKGEMNEDKQMAYETLYECLYSLSQLMSPVAPFFSDWLYQNLTQSLPADQKEESVHLTLLLPAEEKLVDQRLNQRMHLARQLSSMVFSLRKREQIKVRQPLQKIMVPALSDEKAELVESVKDLVLAEVNVKELEILRDVRGVLVKNIKPDFKKLGPRFGKQMKKIAAQVAQFDQEDIAKIETEGSCELEIDGEKVSIQRADVEISTQDIPGMLVLTENGETVALDITITDELRREGLAREVVNRVQNLRKSSGFEVTDRIEMFLQADAELKEAIEANRDYVANETLAQKIEFTPNGGDFQDLEIDEVEGKVEIKRL